MDADAWDLFGNAGQRCEGGFAAPELPAQVLAWSAVSSCQVVLVLPDAAELVVDRAVLPLGGLGGVTDPTAVAVTSDSVWVAGSIGSEPAVVRIDRDGTHRVVLPRETVAVDALAGRGHAVVAAIAVGAHPSGRLLTMTPDGSRSLADLPEEPSDVSGSGILAASTTAPAGAVLYAELRGRMVARQLRGQVDVRSLVATKQVVLAAANGLANGAPAKAMFFTAGPGHGWRAALPVGFTSVTSAALVGNDVYATMTRGDSAPQLFRSTDLRHWNVVDDNQAIGESEPQLDSAGGVLWILSDRLTRLRP